MSIFTGNSRNDTLLIISSDRELLGGCSEVNDREWRARRITEGQEENRRHDVHVHYLECGDYFMGLHIFENL